MARSYSGIFTALALAGLGLACAANNPPEVTEGPRPEPRVVAPGGEVQFVLKVTDLDGDDMKYTWTQTPSEPAGRFSDVHASNPTWTAPNVSETTQFTIQVTVNDSGGGGVLGTAPAVLVRVP
jgi:hypothetical protein